MQFENELGNSLVQILSVGRKWHYIQQYDHNPITPKLKKIVRHVILAPLCMHVVDRVNKQQNLFWIWAYGTPLTHLPVKLSWPGIPAGSIQLTEHISPLAHCLSDEHTSPPGCPGGPNTNGQSRSLLPGSVVVGIGGLIVTVLRGGSEWRNRWIHRSEERRVGKECRSWWSPYHEKKNS